MQYIRIYSTLSIIVISLYTDATYYIFCRAEYIVHLVANCSMLWNITETPPVKSEHRPSTPHFERIVRKHNLRSLYRRSRVHGNRLRVNGTVPDTYLGAYTNKYIKRCTLCAFTAVEQRACVYFMLLHTLTYWRSLFIQNKRSPFYVHQAIVGLYGGMAALCRHSDGFLYAWGKFVGLMRVRFLFWEG